MQTVTRNDKYYRVTWENGETICVTSFLGHPPTFKDFLTYGGLDCLSYGHTEIKSCEEVEYSNLSEKEKGQVSRCYF